MTDLRPATAEQPVRSVHTRSQGLDGLVDALDGLINNGACVVGDVVISVAGIDLIQVNLRALIAAASEQVST